MKKIWANCALTLAIAGALAIPLGAPNEAKADDGGGDSGQAYSQIHDWYVGHGVPDKVASRLAADILHGKMPQSSQPNANPVAEDTHRDGSWVVTTRRFADGSVTESRLEQPLPQAAGGITTLSVGACEGTIRGTNYTNYKNCRVEETSAYLILSFRADYPQAYGIGVVDALRQPYEWAVGGTASTPSFSTSRKSQSSSGPATAVGKSLYKTPYSSANVSITLKVTGTSASSSRSGF